MVYPPQLLEERTVRVPQTCAYEHCRCKVIAPVGWWYQYYHSMLNFYLVLTLLWTYESQAKHHTERSANDSTILWPVSSLWCNMCWLTQHPQYTWRRERNAQLLLCFLSKNLLSHQHSLKLSFLFFTHMKAGQADPVLTQYTTSFAHNRCVQFFIRQRIDLLQMLTPRQRVHCKHLIENEWVLNGKVGTGTCPDITSSDSIPGSGSWFVLLAGAEIYKNIFDNIPYTSERTITYCPLTQRFPVRC